MNPADVFDCIVHDLASSPVTVTAYELFGNEDANVIDDDLGVPLKDATEADDAFNDGIFAAYDAVVAYDALKAAFVPVKNELVI